MALDDEYSIVVVGNQSREAITLCMDRMLADWTREKSDYVDATKFYVLYKEPWDSPLDGEVGATFTAAESEELVELIKPTKAVPETEDEHIAFSEAQFDFCNHYSRLLRARYYGP